MKQIKIELDALTPEHSKDFLQGMLNRMDMSFCKYGRFRVNCTGQYDREFITALKKTLKTFLDKWDGKTWLRAGEPVRTTTANGNTMIFMLRRLVAYLDGKGGDPAGNTEYLMDAANSLMMEFVCPQMPSPYFKATDNTGSTGFAGLSEKELESYQ